MGDPLPRSQSSKQRLKVIMAPNGSPPNGGKVKLNQIVPGVWLGNLYCATDESVLYTSGITAVLSVVDDGDVLYAPRFAANLPSFIHGERHRSIRASDSRSVNLLKHFDEIYDWIDRMNAEPARKTLADLDRQNHIRKTMGDGLLRKYYDRDGRINHKRTMRWVEIRMRLDQYDIQQSAKETSDWQVAFLTGKRQTPPLVPIADIRDDSQTYVKSERNNVLVHCRMGLSRSATIVVAYVMKKFRTSFSAVLDYCKQQTSINPNSGFRRQLQAYEEMGYSIWEDDQRTRHKKEYKEYLAQDLRLKTRVDASGRIHPTTGSLSVRSSSTK